MGRATASQITRLIACGLHNMKMWQLPLMPLPVCKTGKGEPSHANASTTFSPLCLLETVTDNKRK